MKFVGIFCFVLAIAFTASVAGGVELDLSAFGTDSDHDRESQAHA